MLGGRSGAGPLLVGDRTRLNVSVGYHVDDFDAAGAEPPLRASRWLAACVREALSRARVDPARERVVALVGTGLRELRSVELTAAGGPAVATERLHFAGAVREVLGGAETVITVSNACSASGYALALGQDLLEQGEADAVVVAGTDSMTESMLAMVGRVSESPTEQVRPFDSDRGGVLLGDGAAAVVLQPEGTHEQPLARLLGTGLSCDAFHETAPDEEGILRAITDAHKRAGITPADVDLVLAHGTGTALNDPTEARGIRRVFADASPGPLVTACKGAVGHTSGGSALLSLVTAIRCLRTGTVPPVVGLRRPLPEAEGVRLVVGEPATANPRVAQVHAFGFGGLNAVSVLEACA